MTDSLKPVFDRMFEDSARLVMLVVSGSLGVELQCFDRDVDTVNPTVSFLLSDDNITNFMECRLRGKPGVIYLAGVTHEDLEYSRQTGQPFPGMKIG